MVLVVAALVFVVRFCGDSMAILVLLLLLLLLWLLFVFPVCSSVFMLVVCCAWRVAFAYFQVTSILLIAGYLLSYIVPAVSSSLFPMFVFVIPFWVWII